MIFSLTQIEHYQWPVRPEPFNFAGFRVRTRPIPPDMTVADLGADYLWARCPNGHNSRQMNEAFLLRRHAPETRLGDIVARMVCRVCNARAEGTLEDAPRSGAEGKG